MELAGKELVGIDWIVMGLMNERLFGGLRIRVLNLKMGEEELGNLLGKNKRKEKDMFDLGF